MASNRSLRIATSQFPVTGDVEANGRHIRRLVEQAADLGADLLQISEAALSGYGGVDVKDWATFDWNELARQSETILHLAADKGIWLVLGSSHYLGPKARPTNCLYLVNGRGVIVDRYDKRFCTDSDLKMYTPGDHAVVFTLKGFKLGLQICYDTCFPQTYADYEIQGVEVMIHSFYNAHHRGPTCLDEIGPAWVMVRAADHQMWVFAANSSGRHSSWAAMVAAPDGTVQARLRRHQSGLVIQEVSGTEAPHRPYGWVHMGEFRPLYRQGALHNGKASTHPRAIDPRCGPARV